MQGMDYSTWKVVDLKAELTRLNIPMRSKLTRKSGMIAALQQAASSPSPQAFTNYASWKVVDLKAELTKRKIPGRSFLLTKASKIRALDEDDARRATSPVSVIS